MTAASCPGCGRIYRSTVDVVEKGGEVYQSGLALKCRCVCGETWPIGRLWSCTERTIENGPARTAQERTKTR